MGLLAVMVDQRENGWVKALRFGGAPVSTSLLETGDILLMADDGLIAVEHKEASDLLSSIRDGRLFDEVRRMPALTPWSYLAIVGGLYPSSDGRTICDYTEVDWKWPSVQGALLTVQELGVAVMQVPEAEDLEPALLRLVSRSRGTVRTEQIRDALAVSDAEKVLTSLPGIGSDRVKRILDFTGTAAGALAWLTDGHEDGQVAGIGDGIKRRVRQALGLREDQELIVALRDNWPEVLEREHANAK